jgi:transposase
MDLPVVTPRRLLADKGYDSDRIRENLLFRGILPVIPPRSNRTQDIPCDFRRYRDRNRIERMFNRLKQFRRIATPPAVTKLGNPSSPFSISLPSSCGYHLLSTEPRNV